MMMFEVIKNAGVPESKRKYPFPQLEVGDAFDAPVASRNRISSCCLSWAKNNNPTAKFTVRALDENTVRCTRVA